MMKTNLKLLLITVLVSNFSYATAQNSEADKIIGIWQTTDKKGHIEIFKVDQYYYGKLIWGDGMYEVDGKTSKKDTNNEDVTKRNRYLKNLLLLSGFVYRDGIWEDGQIYDPDNGKTYRCKMTLSGSFLKVRGYIGFSLFGRTEMWTRKL